MNDQQSEQPANTTFVKRWSKIRKTADLILTGPRSLMPVSDPTGSESWLEPDIRCEESGLSPLDRKSYVVFFTPACLRDSQKTIAVLRTAVWHGSKNKSACRTQDVGFPIVEINLRTIGNAEIAPLNEALRDLDTSLHTFVPDVEQILQGPQSELNSNVQNEAATSGAVRQLRVYRRFRYSSCDFSWQEDTNTPTIMGIAYARFTNPLVKFALRPTKNGNSDWVERYDIEPDAYMKCLEALD